MESSSIEAEPSREASRRSVVSSLMDALALQQQYFEQSLVSQKLRSKQLADEQEASIKAAAEELATNLIVKHDYAPKEPKFERSDYKEYRENPGDGRRQRSQSRDDNDKRSRGRNLFDADINCQNFPHRSRSRSRDRSLHHQRSKHRDMSQSKDGKWLEPGIFNRSSYHRSRCRSKDKSLIYHRSRKNSRSRSRERSPHYRSTGQSRDERSHNQRSKDRIRSKSNSPLGRKRTSRREKSPHYKRHRGRSRIKDRSISRDRSKSQERELFLTRLQSQRYPKEECHSKGTQNLETAGSFSAMQTDNGNIKSESGSTREENSCQKEKLITRANQALSSVSIDYSDARTIKEHDKSIPMSKLASPTDIEN